MHTFKFKTALLVGGAIAASALAASFAFADTPTAPTGLAATAVSATQINLSWTASTAATDTIAGYDIFRDSVQIATTTGTSTAYSDTGLAAATSHTYAVAAYDSQGDVSAQSAATSAATLAAPDTEAPSVPAGLAASAVSSSQINLSWSASTDNVGVAGYEVFRGGVEIATTTGTTFADTGLAASTTFTYAVAAYDAAGNTSAQSASVTVATLAVTVTPPPPPAPQPRVKPEEISINPNGHILVHGMIVTSVGVNTFMGTVWGITYTVNYQPKLEFLLKGGGNAATSTSQIQVGDEVGVMGAVSHDAPMTIQAQIVRDYSLVITRKVPPGLLKKVENAFSGSEDKNGNGSNMSSSSLRDRIQQILEQITNLQAKLRGNSGHNHGN